MYVFHGTKQSLNLQKLPYSRFRYYDLRWPEIKIRHRETAVVNQFISSVISNYLQQEKVVLITRRLDLDFDGGFLFHTDPMRSPREQKENNGEAQIPELFSFLLRGFRTIHSHAQ